MITECEFEVQGYELDSFNHVNNSVYLNYLESARWKFFKEVDILDYMMRKRIYPIVAETTIKYVRELKIFDEITVKSKWEIDGIYIVAYQDIIRKSDNKKSAKAIVKMVLVSEERLIHDIPDKLKALIINGKNS